VRPVNFHSRGCGPNEVLLRQEVGSGDVVRIESCGDADAGTEDERTYVDRCVKPGTYRYGFAEPYECVSSACSTDYFTEVAVTTPPPPACIAPVHTKAPKVPWGSGQTVALVTGEALSFAVEALVYARVLRSDRAILASATANLASFVVGPLLFF